MTEQPLHTACYRYAIRVQEHLDANWSAWFDGMTITNEAGGEAVLEGPMADQAALHGLLAKLRNLNLSLISVQRLDPIENEETAEQERN